MSKNQPKPEPEVHYVMLPTIDNTGAATGALQIPVIVRPDLPPDPTGALRAEFDPTVSWWLSKAVQEAALVEQFPGLAHFFGPKP